MADKIDIDLTGAAPAIDAQAELKRRLAKRMGFAVVMIALLLAALAVFDRLSQPDLIEPPVPRPPIPVPRQEVAQPLKPAAPAESTSGAGASDKPAVVVEKTSVARPTPAAAPTAEPPPKPEIQAQPKLLGSPAAPPSPSISRSGEIAKLPPAKPENLPPAVAESSAAPIVPAAPAPPPATRAAPAALRPFSGYMLQAGVFASAQQAEELYAKLQLNGIPSTLEARVQAGPFKSRAEADAARDKLKSLGVDSVLIPPRRAKR